MGNVKRYWRPIEKHHTDKGCVTECYTLGRESPGMDKWAVGLLIARIEEHTTEYFVRPLMIEQYVLGDRYIPFECSEWPPTEEDVRKAEVVAIMNRGG